MYLAMHTGWSVEYIYGFDIDDFQRTVKTLQKLRGEDGGAEKSNVKRVPPAEYFDKYITKETK
jgi:hypothetical protein